MKALGLVASAVLALTPFHVSASRPVFPSEVLVRGTDIATEPHNVTLRLRDALEALIAGRNPTPGGIVTKIYLPDDVALIGNDRFRYRVRLVDAQLRTLRSNSGVCRLSDTSSCAWQILQGLGVEQNRDRPSTAASPPSVPVEIRRVGDDGLTVRFADALEAGIRRSARFTMAGHDRLESVLIVEIPTNIEWSQIGDRTQVRFQIEFRRGGSHLLGRSRGSCWDTHLETCVSRVLRDAGNVIR